ncbi:hypothetical protein VYU27_000409 [Nannochloropsis oceanica]
MTCGSSGMSGLEAVRVQELQRGCVVSGTAPVTCLDYHREGEYLVTAAEDGTVHLINALEGKARKKLFCKKYGVELARFTHHAQSVLCSSRPSASQTASALGTTAHDIRYLSLYDNQYLRFFSGHEARVTALAMSYTDDRFMSASVDGTVRIWTLQQPKCLGQGNIQIGGGGSYSNSSSSPCPVLAEFDPSGLVFAVCAQVQDRHLLKLYDARKFSEGAFENFGISENELRQTLLAQQPTIDPEVARKLVQAPWIDMSFSADGKNLLVSTKGGMTLVIDTYDLQVTRFLTGYKNEKGLNITACYTSDVNHILTGSEEGEVCVFDATEERVMDGVVCRLSGHTGPVRQVKCNPVYEQVASACNHVVLWITPPRGK